MCILIFYRSKNHPKNLLGRIKQQRQENKMNKVRIRISQKSRVQRYPIVISQKTRCSKARNTN